MSVESGKNWVVWLYSIITSSVVLTGVSLILSYQSNELKKQAMQLSEAADQRSEASDLRARKKRFQELVLMADNQYCRTVDYGVPFQLRLLLDHAANLEPGLKNELVALDYITLASIGSSFWSYKKAHDFGLDGLELGRDNKDPLEQYAANLILGHIDFEEYKKKKLSKFLPEARSHFGEAEKIAVAQPTPQGEHFSGQLYLLWGEHEFHSGHEEEGEEKFKLAKNSWETLHQSENRLAQIDHKYKKAKNGTPPKLPCPSQITFSPRIISKPELPESRFEVEHRTSEPSVEALPEVFQEDLSGRIDKLENRISELPNEISVVVKNLIADQPVNKDNESKSDLFDNTDTPPNDLPESIYERQINPKSHSKKIYLIVLENQTFYNIQPLINGYAKPSYIIKPGETRRFRVANKHATIGRTDTNSGVRLDDSCYVDNPLECNLVFTDCCIQLKQTSANEGSN